MLINNSNSKSRVVSVGRMIVLVAIIGVSINALLQGSEFWFQFTYAITIFMIFIAIIKARHGSDFFFGFFSVGFLYFILGFGPWFNNICNSNFADKTSNPSMPTSNLLRVFCDNYIVKEVSPGHAQYANKAQFRYYTLVTTVGIAHNILTLIFASCGGIYSIHVGRKKNLGRVDKS